MADDVVQLAGNPGPFVSQGEFGKELAFVLELLGTHGQQVLSRTAFFVASPALLFDTLAAADVQAVLGPQLVVAGVSALAAGGIYLLVARLLLPRRDGSETIIGALSASMVNSANLGIPIAAYVLGDAALAAPVLGPGGALAGVLALQGPAARLTAARRREVRAALLAAAGELGRRLGG